MVTKSCLEPGTQTCGPPRSSVHSHDAIENFGGLCCQGAGIPRVGRPGTFLGHKVRGPGVNSGSASPSLSGGSRGRGCGRASAVSAGCVGNCSRATEEGQGTQERTETSFGEDPAGRPPLPKSALVENTWEGLRSGRGWLLLKSAA